MASDDAIAFVIPSNSGSGRAGTPQSTRPPSRPRAEMNPALRTLVMPPPKPQVISRRKQRRWQNDNLIGVGKFRRDLYSGEGPDDDDTVEEKYGYGRYMRYPIKVEWRSMFAELLEEQNEDVRKMYLSCASVHVEHDQPSKIHRSEIEEARDAWMQVEKRLRSIVVRVMEDAAFCAYIEAVEATLMYFVENNDVPPPQVIPSELSLALSEPLACRKEGDATFLVVPLQDSAFHRLLLHAACQFYGLKSRSVNEGSRRVTLVSQTRRRRHQISLVAYVLATTRSGAKLTRLGDEGDMHVGELPVAMDALMLDARSDRSASDEWLVVSDIVVSVPVTQRK